VLDTGSSYVFCPYCLSADPDGVLGVVSDAKNAGRASVNTHVTDVLQLVADQSGKHLLLDALQLHTATGLRQPTKAGLAVTRSSWAISTDLRCQNRQKKMLTV